jgi:hypothetical protein
VISAPARRSKEARGQPLDATVLPPLPLDPVPRRGVHAHELVQKEIVRGHTYIIVTILSLLYYRYYIIVTILSLLTLCLKEAPLNLSRALATRQCIPIWLVWAFAQDIKRVCTEEIISSLLEPEHGPHGGCDRDQFNRNGDGEGSFAHQPKPSFASNRRTPTPITRPQARFCDGLSNFPAHAEGDPISRCRIKHEVHHGPNEDTRDRT